MAETPATRTVDRRIIFYRADGGLDTGGRPHPVDLGPSLEHIDGLPFSDDGRYLTTAEDVFTCCWVDGLGRPSRLRLATIRRSGLPQVEDVGTLLPLEIAESQGIADQTYITLFPVDLGGIPSTIAGAVFNFYGPRVPRLGYYLSNRAPGTAPRVTFRPLLRRDAAETLERLRDIRLFRLRVQPSYIDAIEGANESLGTSFALAREQGDAQDVEVVLRAKRYSRQPISERLLDVARRLSRRDDLREGVLQFEVRGLNGETGSVDLVDVMNDKLVTSRRILRQAGRGRGLEDGSAYAAIEDAYRELEPELIRSATVWAPE